ncbi:uncharacterized protein Z518_09109 [Rhinocladiella mackenziei CBS 650.93]|uniref:Uncharacterized protein n=1 Tax=Rhinocladiella mackenziei CBS 650.93 TaxID=1442369 RepID=A0A0D2I6F3_9EURO|nr:uncharacterized protein Z518_09109 [Rhinocladiella mackenziei CBS 650.93]KIX01384.1 hypothetical protein Z518_09109 [Rhinocladiella mackenziei CBS 650.93]
MRQDSTIEPPYANGTNVKVFHHLILCESLCWVHNTQFSVVYDHVDPSSLPHDLFDSRIDRACAGNIEKHRTKLDPVLLGKVSSSGQLLGIELAVKTGQCANDDNRFSAHEDEISGE